MLRGILEVEIIADIWTVTGWGQQHKGGVSGFRVWGLGLRVSEGFLSRGFFPPAITRGFRVSGLGVKGSGFRV